MQNLVHFRVSERLSEGVAASTRVGNLIGARSAKGAMRAGHLAALLSVVCGTIVMISMIAAKDVRDT